MVLNNKSEKTANAVLPPRLGVEVDLREVRTAPLKFLDESTRSCGTVFSYGAGPWQAVVVNKPVCVKRILDQDGEAYTKMGTPDLMMLKPMLGDGLMTSEGPAWKEQRDEATYSFSRQNVTGYIPQMRQFIEVLVERCQTLATSGEAVDVETEMNGLTLQIVVKCLFGFDLGDQTGEFAKAVETMNKAMAHFDSSGESMRQTFDAALSSLHRIVTQIVMKRQLFGLRGMQDDLLTRLIDTSTGRQLFDRVFTFVMAGHETTAKSLCWALHLISHHPEVEQRLFDEVDELGSDTPIDMDNIGKLAYARAVLQEAVRLYPPVWLMSRIATVDDVAGGYHIQKGSLVLISPYILHRHPDYWQDPLAFNPERFLGADTPAPQSYMPFGYGPRMCIGRFFAQNEGIMTIASLVRKFRLKPQPGAIIEPEALITLRPKGGLPLLFHKR